MRRGKREHKSLPSWVLFMDADIDLSKNIELAVGENGSRD